MDQLIEQATALKQAIKAKQTDIDNPALVSSIINELDFFIENVGADVDED